MKNVRLILPTLTALMIGLWIGFGAGVNSEFRRSAIHQSWLLLQYHEALEEVGQESGDVLSLIAQQANNMEEISRSSVGLGGYDLWEMFKSGTDGRFSKMRESSDEYLKKIGVRPQIEPL